MNKGFNVYGMSDTNDSWMESSPELHNDYIRTQDKRLSGKLKPLIRFIKALKFYRNIKIISIPFFILLNSQGYIKVVKTLIDALNQTHKALKQYLNSV